MGGKLKICPHNQDMNSRDKTNADARKPECLSEQVGESVIAPFGGQPIIATWNVDEVVGQEPREEQNNGHDEGKGQAEDQDEPEMKGSAHPTVGLAAAVKMRGQALRQLAGRHGQIREETQIQESENQGRPARGVHARNLSGYFSRFHTSL